jgi:hypothetical protein
MHRRVHLLATNVGAQAVGVLRTGPSGNGLGLIPTRHHKYDDSPRTKNRLLLRPVQVNWPSIHWRWP